MNLSSHAKRSLIAVGAGVVLIGAVLGIRAATHTPALERLNSSAGADGRTVYEGSWLFPRFGPYKVGFHSPNGEALLVIDGQPIACGRGLVAPVREHWRAWPNPKCKRHPLARGLPAAAPSAERRKPYHAGVVSVRFEAPPGARLLWVPAGRRGDPEYVAASSLSPKPPAEASFDSPGTFHRDGVFALLIGLVILGVIGFVCRDRLRRIDRRVAVCTLGVFVFALGFRLWGLNDAGPTWDEDVNWASGRNYVQNLLGLDFDQSSWIWNYQHPPVMKYMAGFGAQWADGYGPARFISALAVALACALLVPIGQRLSDLRVGILAGVIASLTPHVLAHSKVVGHEAPTMLWWTLAVWLCLRAWDKHGDADPDRRQLAVRFAVIGVVLGVAIMSRFVNVLMAPMIGGILLAQAPSGRRKETIALGISVIPLVALAVSFLIWPRLWSTPIAHFQESWARLTGEKHGLEPFLGKLTNSPPRTYFFSYLVATAPVGILLGALAWLARLVIRRERASWLLLMWIVAPLLVLLSPVRQDGVRYIMPTLLAMSLAAAIGIGYLAELIANRVQRFGVARWTWALGGLLAAYLFMVCVRIHPYYLDYYGEVYGGPGEVAENKAFETAWWGEGLHEALGYINREAPPGASVDKRCVAPAHLAWLRGDLWEPVERYRKPATWFLHYAPLTLPCRIPAKAELVYEVNANGAPLARVYRLPPLAEARSPQ